MKEHTKGVYEWKYKDSRMVKERKECTKGMYEWKYKDSRKVKERKYGCWYNEMCITITEKYLKYPLPTYSQRHLKCVPIEYHFVVS